MLRFKNNKNCAGELQTEEEDLARNVQMMSEIINILPDGSAKHGGVLGSSPEKLMVTNASRASSQPPANG